jgi:hypothetical protein
MMLVRAGFLPQDMPTEIRRLMEDCWKAKEIHRPEMSEVLTILNNFLECPEVSVIVEEKLAELTALRLEKHRQRNQPVPAYFSLNY